MSADTLAVGDVVVFTRTIWEGRVGKIHSVDADGRIRVRIPGTDCHARHEYSVSAVTNYVAMCGDCLVPISQCHHKGVK